MERRAQKLEVILWSDIAITDAELPDPPDPWDSTLSKRQFEKRMQRWRDAVRVCIRAHRDGR